MKRLIGRAICWWRGKHVERRVPLYDPLAKAFLPDDYDSGRYPNAYNRMCARCGRTRLAVPRKRHAE